MLNSSAISIIYFCAMLQLCRLRRLPRIVFQVFNLKELVASRELAKRPQKNRGVIFVIEFCAFESFGDSGLAAPRTLSSHDSSVVSSLSP